MSIWVLIVELKSSGELFAGFRILQTHMQVFGVKKNNNMAVQICTFPHSRNQTYTFVYFPENLFKERKYTFT